jgi:ABC-type branched-subunit amino acid transport system substrate-binding protein
MTPIKKALEAAAREVWNGEGLGGSHTATAKAAVLAFLKALADADEVLPSDFSHLMMLISEIESGEH